MLRVLRGWSIIIYRLGFIYPLCLGSTFHGMPTPFPLFTHSLDISIISSICPHWCWLYPILLPYGCFFRHGGPPSHHVCFNTPIVIHDWMIRGGPNDFGHLQMYPNIYINITQYNHTNHIYIYINNTAMRFQETFQYVSFLFIVWYIENIPLKHD